MQKQQKIMYFRVLVVISLLKLSECQYGTAELIKFSVPRRSRLLSDFTETQTPPPNYDESVQARSLPITEKSIDQQLDSTPSSTVDELNDEPVPTADTLRKYARIFKMDTENLNEQQRMLLTKIVQRIARLNGANSDEQSIDLNGNEGRARHRNRDERKKSQKKPHPAQTNGDLVPNSSSSTSEPTRSTTVATKSKTNQQSAAQKKKVAASNSHNHIAIETTLPFSVTVTEPTVPASKSGKMRVTQANDATLSNASSVDLGNITTTSIVNILSTDNARENLYIRRPSPATIAAIHDKLPSHHKPQSVKPTKYHFYPHNQHIYLLPECAIQQVCNAVYVRLNYTQPLCACPARYRDPCSASIDEDDLHTTKLIGDQHRRAITLAKTCESTTEMRECRTPRDWSLLALQNIRTGKSHYLVICRCPDSYNLEGPMAHDQPTYASVPGIRVFGMMCVKPDGQSSGPIIQRPVPPKRNQYFQVQSSYYQRYKKHALSKLAAQQKTNENLSTQSSDSSDFTTRGISVISSNPENREGLDSDESSAEMPSSTYDSTSASFSPTVTTIDVSSAEPTTPTLNSVSRAKRTTDNKFDAISSSSESDEQVTMENDRLESSSRSRHADDWPSIPWEEIRKQIDDIQWE